jgi:hypothetical protein
VWRVALRFDCSALDVARLRWEFAECAALEQVPEDIAQESRRWRHGVRGHALSADLSALWAAAQVLTPVSAVAENEDSDAWQQLVAELGAKGKGTLRELILQLSGEDIFERVRAADSLRAQPNQIKPAGQLQRSECRGGGGDQGADAERCQHRVIDAPQRAANTENHPCSPASGHAEAEHHQVVRARGQGDEHGGAQEAGELSCCQ